MRKLVSIAVSAALMLSLAACGKADSSAAASSESKSSASSSSASSNSTSNSTQDYSPDGIKVGETYTTEDGKTYERVWNGTGSDLPTPSPEPKITYDNDFQAQTLVDNEECTIILQSVGYDDDYGYYWKLYPAKAGYSWKATPVAFCGKPHNSLPGMLHGDEPCSCRPGIPRFQSWEVSILSAGWTVVRTEIHCR